MVPHARHLRWSVLAAALIVVATPAVAAAHIDPDPAEAPAGSAQSVGFTVEHGCDGSATVQLDMRLPDGVTQPVPEPPAGWTASITDNVVTFVGGPLPDEVPGTFRVQMTLPATPDTTIYFPFVQRCQVGEIRWIDLPDGGGELDEPAPAMALTALQAPPPTTVAPTAAAPPTAAPTISPTTAAAATTTSSATTTPRSTTTTSSPINSTSTTTSTSLGVTEARADSATGTIVFVVLVVILAGFGALLVRTARRRS